MELLALALAPGIAISIYIYRKDKVNKEPISLLLMRFFAGALCTIPAGFIQIFLTKPLEKYFGNGIQSTLVMAYGLVAVSEELCKFLTLRLLPFKRAHFDEPFDGIVYAVMVGMGFATLENIFYVYQHGISTGILRMFTAVPAHATFAILMGFYVGLAKFYRRKRTVYYFMAIVLPILFHGTYDFFLFLGKTSYHLIGAGVSLIVAIKLSQIALKRNQEITDKYNNRHK